jgi:membrane protease subunit HflK
MKKNKLRIISYLLIIGLLTGYFASGFYSLQSGQRALILRFGEVVHEVSESGIHYHLPFPIEQIVKAHVSEVQTLPIQEQVKGQLERFTGDENLIVVCALISFDVNNLSAYLFHVQDIKALIQATGQNSMSWELATMPVDEVMTSGKSVLRRVMKENVQDILDELNTGVRVISVELTDIAPPLDVSQAFKAVSDARVRKQRIIKEAEGYANVAIPEARGQVSSIIAKAEAYAKEVLDAANGQVRAFNDLLAEYRRNPKIIARLKYLETLQTISKKSRIIIDTEPVESIYYIDYGRK